MSKTETNDEIIDNKRHKRRRIGEEVDERVLESIVFGRDSDVLENINKKSKIKEIDKTFGIIEDRNVRQEEVTDSEDSEGSDDSKEDINYSKTGFNLGSNEVLSEETQKKSVWSDSDDGIDVSDVLKDDQRLPKKVTKDDKYKDYLENKFNDLYKRPKWALIDDKDWKRRSSRESSDSSSDDTDDSDDGLNRTTQRFKVKSKELQKGFLDFKKCSHLTNDNKIKSSLNCIEFHPSSTVAMVSSPNGRVRLFQVDGKINARIQSIEFKDFKIEIAKFNKSGEELIVGSKRDSGFYYYYDMICGKIVKIPFIKGKQKYCLEKFELSNDNQLIASKGNNGFIHVLTTKTKEHIFDLKMNGEVMSLGFTDDSNMLLSHGTGGKCYVWDIRKRQCINRFTDEGCVSGTAIALSPNGKYCCTGSDMGVVNVYKFNDVLTQSQPKPLKSLMNLTTEISHLKFNHNSELLLMSSGAKDNSIKCVHMKSLTVYSNFPFAAKNYGRIYDLDVSLNSGYLSFATNGGTAHLFRLNHFSDY